MAVATQTMLKTSITEKLLSKDKKDILGMCNLPNDSKTQKGDTGTSAISEVRRWKMADKHLPIRKRPLVAPKTLLGPK